MRSFPFEIANLVNYARDDDIAAKAAKVVEDAKAAKTKADSGDAEEGGQGGERKKSVLTSLMGGLKDKDREKEMEKANAAVMRSPIPPSPRPTKDHAVILGMTKDEGNRGGKLGGNGNSGGNSKPKTKTKNRCKDGFEDDDLERGRVSPTKRGKTGSF